MTLGVFSPQSKCSDQRKEVERKREVLQRVRRELVMAVHTCVFPVQVEALSVDDAGEDGQSGRGL